MTLPDGLIPVKSRTFPVPVDAVPSVDGTRPIWQLPDGTGDCCCSCGSDVDSSTIILPPKSSADCPYFALDFSEWLGEGGDYLIGNPTVSFPDNTDSEYNLVAIFAKLYGTTEVVVMLASGQPRQMQQRILVQVGTEQGLTKTVTCSIRITNASPATLPPSTAQIPSDATLNGNVYMVGATAPQYPLFSNGGVLMTRDADNPPAGSIANRTDPTSPYGVLMPAS